MGWWKRLRRWLGHAFAVRDAEQLSPEERALLDRIGDRVRGRGLQPAAVLFLESVRPLNFVGSQLLTALKPFLDLVVSEKETALLAAALEKRASIDYLVRRIENGERA